MGFLQLTTHGAQRPARSLSDLGTIYCADWRAAQMFPIFRCVGPLCASKSEPFVLALPSCSLRLPKSDRLLGPDIPRGCRRVTNGFLRVVYSPWVAASPWVETMVAPNQRTPSSSSIPIPSRRFRKFSIQLMNKGSLPGSAMPMGS